MKEVLKKQLEVLIEDKKDYDTSLSVKKQAELMGIPYPTFMKYVNGETICGIDKLVLIANYYNVSADFLLGRTETKSLNEDIQGTCKVTGLSEKAVNALIYQKDNTQKNEKDQSYYLSIFSELIEDEQFRRLIALLGTLREMSKKVVPLCHTPDDIMNFSRIAKTLNISIEEVQKQFALKINTIFDNSVENAEALDYIDLFEKLTENGIIQRNNNLDKECRIFKLEVFETFFRIVDSFDCREEYKHYDKQQLIEYLNLKPLLEQIEKEGQDHGKHNQKE